MIVNVRNVLIVKPFSQHIEKIKKSASIDYFANRKHSKSIRIASWMKQNVYAGLVYRWVLFSLFPWTGLVSMYCRPLMPRWARASHKSFNGDVSIRNRFN